MSAFKFEEWTLGVSFALAIAISLALHSNDAPSLATEAKAAVAGAPGYFITVTAKRLPAECKGVDLKSSLACAAFANSETTAEFRAH